MSDEVKIGGDSKELIDAIDRAEARFQRFENAVNSGGFDKEVLERQKRIIDSTTVSLNESATAARKATVDWKALADEKARAAAFLEGQTKRGKTAADFKPARPGQYLDPIAIEEQARLEANAVAVAKLRRSSERMGGDGGRSGIARVTGDMINLATGTSGAVMRVNALSHVLGGIGPAAGVIFAGAAIAKIAENAKETSIAVRALFREFDHKPTDLVGQGSSSSILEQIGRERDLSKSALDKIGRINSDTGLWSRLAQVRRVIPTFEMEHAVSEDRKELVRREASRRRAQLEKSLVDRASERTNIVSADASGDERRAAILQAELATRERIAAIELNRNISKSTKAPLIEEENKQLDIQKEKIERAYARKERDLELETKLAHIRGQGGDNAGVDEARAKYAAAWLETQKAVGALEQKNAQAKLAAAGAELTAAIRAREVARETYQLSVARANIQQLVARSSVDANPEQRERIALQAAHQQAQEALRIADEKVQKAEEEGRLTDELRGEQRQANADVQTAAAALEIFDKDRAFAHEQSLNAAKATTMEMQAQANGQEFLARQAALTAKYQGLIAQAIRDGRDDLVAQYKIQQAIEQQTLKRQKFMAGGDEGEKNRAGRVRAANDSIDQQIADEEDRRRRGAYTHHPDAYGDSRTGRAHPEAYGGPGRSNKRMSDDDWRDQFKTRSQLRDRAQDKRAVSDKPDAGAKDGAQLIGKIDSLISTLNALPSKIAVL